MSNFSDRHHSSVGRIKCLPSITRELEIVKKLEAYFSKRIAYLKEQEETQKKLRDSYRYSRLPRLPTEITIRILSNIHSENVVDTEIPEALSVVAYGLLPYLILKPYLMLPPYSKNFNKKSTLYDINDQTVDMPILMDTDISSTVNLEVCVYDWRMLQSSQDTLHILLRIPHRWKELGLYFQNVRQIRPMLDTFAPCLPHLKELITRNEVHLASSMSYPSLTSIASYSSKRIFFPIHALPAIFTSGILDHVTELYLNDFSFFDRGSWNSSRRYAMKRFPDILSNLPSLKMLSAESPTYYADGFPPKVQSSSLKSLKILSDGSRTAQFLLLFSDCPIDTIFVGSAGIVANMVNCFPGLRDLTCVSKLANPINNCEYNLD